MIPYHIIVGDEGPADLVFGSRNLLKLEYVQSVSFDGNELQSDEVYATIRAKGNVDDWLALWSGVRKDTPVYLVRDDNARREKFYFKSLARVAKYDFELTAQSPIGKLESEFHGGLYDGQRLPEVIADVLRDETSADETSADENAKIVPYSVNPALKAVLVYGWAPYQSRRDALRLLARAYGFVIRRDESGDLHFTVPDTQSYEIPPDAIFTSGSVDYSMGKTYYRVDVTQYAFLPSSDGKETTLYDNTESGMPANRQLIKFSAAPCYNVRADGLEVIESGVNYAVVSGVGTLYGTPYTRTESVVSVDGDPDADPNNILTIDGVTLITSLNAESVGERWRDIRNAPAIVHADLWRTSQKSGDFVEFTDPYGDERTGYITALSGSVTSIDKLSAEILTGYVPSWGADYDAVQVLDKPSGNWPVPAYLDGKTIRVVLVSGGTGGASGQRGTDNRTIGGATVEISGCGHGDAGSGGKVNVIKLSVTAGQVFHYECGTGGAGGLPSADYDATEETKDGKTSVSYAYRKNSGTAGTASTFAEVGSQNPAYTSDDGASMPSGYYDVINGVSYGATGPDNGVDGGKATTGRENGDRTNPAYIDITQYPIDQSERYGYWGSGNIGAGKWLRNDDYQRWAYGGLGGGAAVERSGGDGRDAPDYDIGGQGGDGADATAIFPTDTHGLDPRAYGTGGSGGHGGGEGGQGGSGNTTENPDLSIDGARGAGGSGSAGQDGKEGCILIYYRKPDSLPYRCAIVNGILRFYYYTESPPDVRISNGHLYYKGDDTLIIRDGRLYRKQEA